MSTKAKAGVLLKSVTKFLFESFDLFPVIGSLSLNNEALAIVIFEIVKFSVEEN
jgi:hypothetical protein